MEAKRSAAPPRTRFERLPRESFVFRLVTINETFLPKGAEFPVGQAFAPTDADEKEATERGAPVLVSVWEHGVTTTEQAAAIRRADAEAAGRPAREYRPYWLGTAQIEDSGPPSRLGVLHDPRPLADGPGADGHAGITGLGRSPEERKGEGKKAWKEMLDKLAENSRREPP